MKIIDLFSGIGGFSLGLEATGGFKTIQFVENEPWCQKILAKNFPGVPIAGDIREYDGQKADIVVGGFPCQPFSVAGKRKGTRDDRHLWPEMLRVIKACKPRWVIGENVRNLTSIQDGMVFEQVCTDLEEQGYEVQSFVIPASAVNAPHQRYRVWIVAYSENRGREQTEWKRRQSLERGSYDSGGIKAERQEVVRNVAHSNNNGQQGGLFETRNQTFTRQRSKIIRRNGANMLSRSGNDGRNQTESTVNGTIQGSCHGNKTESSATERLCGVFEESNNYKNTLRADKHQENHDRTLVQERQQGVQSSEHTGLGDDKTISERDKVRPGDDTVTRDRVETTTDVANSESNKQDGISRETESEHDKRNSWMESQCSRNRQSVGKPEQNVADSKISERDALQTNREYGETSPQEVFRDRSCIQRQTSWWSFEPNVGRVAHGIPDRVDRLKGLGNAIVPQIAYQIGLAILQAEKEK